MLYSTQELYLRYKDYKTPHVKIRTEVKNKRLFPVVRGLYEDRKNISAYLLVSYIKPQAYLSFEYVLSYCGLIPERVLTVMAATVGKTHNELVQTPYGNFYYQDVPRSAYRFGIRVVEEDGYAYLMASPEKALCDLLYKKKPTTSIKEFKTLLFEDLRIDKSEFFKLKREDLLFLCPLYKKKNLNFLGKYVEGCNEFSNQPNA
jgi:predicted transcriptional regulator of viral defense system